MDAKVCYPLDFYDKPFFYNALSCVHPLLLASTVNQIFLSRLLSVFPSSPSASARSTRLATKTPSHRAIHPFTSDTSHLATSRPCLPLEV